MATLYSFCSTETLAQYAAKYWIRVGQQAIQDKGSFHIALSGGSTPKKIHQIITDPAYRDQLDWSKVHFYFGDERCVPPNHIDSNFRMANETLFSKISCHSKNIHRMQGELKPQTAAQLYAETLHNHLPWEQNKQPYFDLILLGMGPDGHTASLFPNTTALSIRNKNVAANYVEKLHAWRITLTYPMLNSAHKILIIAHGEKKQPVLKTILASPSEQHYPIMDIKPNGELVWYLDDKASQGINAAFQYIQG